MSARYRKGHGQAGWLRKVENQVSRTREIKRRSSNVAYRLSLGGLLTDAGCLRKTISRSPGERRYWRNSLLQELREKAAPPERVRKPRKKVAK